MKENKGEQPEREIKSILKKYEKYVSNIEWHIRVNKPHEEEIKKLNAQIDYYNEMISDLNGIAVQPSKVQEKEILELNHAIVIKVEQLAAKEKEIEDLKKENELLEAREVAWQNKHLFLMEEIQRLKELLKTEYFKKLSYLLHTDKALNNLWYEFSIKNNL